LIIIITQHNPEEINASAQLQQDFRN